MTTETEPATEHGSGPDLQVLVALVFGTVLMVVGLAGPVLCGAESELLGLFGRNYLDDAIHLVSGGVGLLLGVAAGGSMSDEYNRYLGAVYLFVFAVGSVLLAGLTGIAGLIDLNWADNALHLLLGVVLAGVGSR